jgi:hypothetical protein
VFEAKKPGSRPAFFILIISALRAGFMSLFSQFWLGKRMDRAFNRTLNWIFLDDKAQRPQSVFPIFLCDLCAFASKNLAMNALYSCAFPSKIG